MSIKSIVDFIDVLQDLKSDKESEYYFRGHSNHDFELKPSIYRGSFIRNENNIFKEAILRNPNDFINEKTALEKLVKMQHYGLPTRLLDITKNPLVALYFAVNEQPKKNGEIIVFKIPKINVKFYDSDTVSILSNIAKRPHSLKLDSSVLNNSKNDNSHIIEFNYTDEIQYLLHEIKEEKPYFLSIINPNDLTKVVAVRVKMNNNRIVRQNGAFLIFGIKGTKSVPAEIPDDWIIDYDDKLKIDGNDKESIVNELDVLGINESSLFPELENQAKYLRRLYR